MELKNPYKEHIIINSLMRGRILPDEVNEQLAQ
jgi:hypothetical protein